MKTLTFLFFAAIAAAVATLPACKSAPPTIDYLEPGPFTK
jgi:hypothetical protein